jgi:hypothetical protein
MTRAAMQAAPAAGIRLVGWLATIIMTLFLTLSPMALNGIGWNYDGLGGAGPTRFHPATYLALITVIIIAIQDGNPVASIARTFAADAYLSLFLVIWTLVFLHGVINQGLPAAGLIDTFLVPMLLLIIFRRTDAEARLRMATLIHIIFAVNALIGFAEFGTGLRLTPYIAGGVLITDDWRSTALLGHPLGNALMTGCYVIVVMLGGGRLLTGWKRPCAIGLQVAAMVPFGGRASMVVLMLFLAVVLALKLMRFLSGGRLDLRLVTLVAVMLPAGLAALALLVELGVFDQFIMRFVNDNDSAQARVKMFELFNGFTLEELLFGPQQDHLGYLVRVYRLEFGIESVWVAFSLYYGLIPMVLFFTGVFFYLLSLMSHCQKRAWIVMGYFFLINTTFLGIAGKSISLSNLSMILFLLMPAVAHPAMPAWRQPAWHQQPRVA